MYYLYLNNGARIEFYLRGCAEIYQRCYGGRIVRSELVKLAA